MTELNCHFRITKAVYYHCTNPAITLMSGEAAGFEPAFRVYTRPNPLDDTSSSIYKALHIEP